MYNKVDCLLYNTDALFRGVFSQSEKRCPCRRVIQTSTGSASSLSNSGRGFAPYLYKALSAFLDVVGCGQTAPEQFGYTEYSVHIFLFCVRDGLRQCFDLTRSMLTQEYEFLPVKRKSVIIYIVSVYSFEFSILGNHRLYLSCHMI